MQQLGGVDGVVQDTPACGITSSRVPVGNRAAARGVGAAE